MGAESYGLYVFAMSIVTYFISFVSFGFDFPAVKAIAQNQDDNNVKAHTLSCVLTAKIYILIPSFLIFVSLIALVPGLSKHWEIYAILFGNVFVNILFPIWYFQGIQKMRLVTYIQLVFKLLSLPFIFWAIVGPADIWKFALIITVSNLSGGLIAALMINYYERLHFRLMPYSELKKWYKDALPFFWTSAVGVIKQQSIPVIIGVFFNMSNVAVYDLAYKIFSVPNILFGSINGALFPKIAIDNNKNVIKKVLRLEMLAGFLVIFTVIVLGRWIVIILGGLEMLGAYPIAVVMSFGVLTFLLVGGYISFIFVPQNRYYLITKNQILAFFIFFIFTAVGLLIWKNILVIAIAWSLAGLFEILYCNILIKKYKLF